MADQRTIYITEYDTTRLMDLLSEARHTEYRGSKYLESLRAELERSVKVSPKEIPPDVITMNSTVRLEDQDSGEEMVYTLVFPQDADPAQDRISVLAPVGTAMLGYRVGDSFAWEVPDGVRHIKVKAILFQPEASGNFEL